MIDNKIVLKNLIFASISKVLNFSFLFLMPIVVKNTNLSDSNLFFYTSITLFLSLFSVIFTNVISVFIIKENSKNIYRDKAFDIIVTVFNWLILIIISLFIFYFFFEKNIQGFVKVRIYDNQIRLFFLIFVFQILIDYGRCVLQSFNLFNTFSLGIVFQTIIQVILFFLYIQLHLFIGAFVYSLLFSNLFLLIYIICNLKRNGLIPKYKLSFKISEEYNFVKISLPLLMAHFVTVFVGFSFDYFVSGFDKGTYTIYNLSFRIFNLPIVFILTPLTEIINKRFTELSVKSKSELSIEVVKIIKLIFVAITPISLILILFCNHDVITYLLQLFHKTNVIYGSNSLKLFSNMMSILCLYLFFNVITQISARVYFSLSKTFFTSIVGSSCFLLSFFALMIFSKSMYGILLSKVLPEMLYLVPISLFLMKKYLVNFRIKKILYLLFKSSGLIVLIYGLNHFGISLYEIYFQFNMIPLLILITLSIALYYLTYRKDLNQGYSQVQPILKAKLFKL
jgi:hypothetical protein